MEDSEDLDKVYRGAYSYFEMNHTYSEESFEVYRNHFDQSYQFSCEVISRVANGELLKVYVRYKMSKDFLPIYVITDRSLGSQHVQEIYLVDHRENNMQYSFHTKTKSTVIQVGLPPKFYIASPCTATSFLFFLNKKYDVAGKNYYSFFTAKNMWDYENPPTQERVMVEAPNQTPISIKSGDSTLQCNLYNMYEEKDEKKLNPLNFYISKHLAIPYRITSPHKLKIEIKYLNLLENNRASLI